MRMWERGGWREVELECEEEMREGGKGNEGDGEGREGENAGEGEGGMKRAERKKERSDVERGRK